MQSFVRKPGGLWSFVILAGLSAVLSGCNLLGPASISQGRPAYNEVINRTNDEQMLLGLVRSRYGDSPSLLTVTNVTASLKFRAATGAQAGFGLSPGNYAGNLIPFSAGLAYEESPTISYAPVQGDLYMRQVLAPVALELLVGFLRSRASPGGTFTLLVKRINNIRNPDFLPSSSAVPDPRFLRLVELIDRLHRVGVLSFATISAVEQEFALVIRDYVPGHLPAVQELMTLLSLPARMGSQDIVVPMSPTVERGKTERIAITTRSLGGLIEIMTAAIEVPEEAIRSGLVLDYPPAGLVGRAVRIRRSEESPDKASVRVKYRDTWYYIADTDQRTKRSFRFLELLWGISIASSTTSQPAPVLTVGVGK